MEIERKWLLKKLPQQLPKGKYFIEQFYLSLEPEVRLRRAVPNGDYVPKVPYRIAIKGSGDLSRIEIQSPVTEDFYAQAREFVNLQTVEKHLLEYEVDEHELSIAVVLTGEGFIYAEVEFETEEEALAYQFPWPELIEKEVTYDSEYKMKNVWRKLYNK